MKRLFLLLALLLVASIGRAAQDVYPGNSWSMLAAPEEAGWSSAKLMEAETFSKTIGTAAVVIVRHGVVVHQWGRTEKHFNVHSIRKSFLSSMYGIPEFAARINLDDTMEKLSIDDNEPALTPLEKQATVLDLLKARSGVYHPALYETESMKKRRPARHSHAPGSFWYYNNWDFNVLGTIFEKQTGQSIFTAFQTRIAQPLHMQDFRLSDTEYFRGDDSIHPAYPFRMTARDMARFGLLFARHGKWNGKQIIPAQWVDRSVTSYSLAESDTGKVSCGYGFLWWTEAMGRQLENVRLPRGSFSARGAGGHYILIIPAWDLVIVHRVDTDLKDGPKVSGSQFGQLVNLITQAMPESAKPQLALTPASLKLPASLDDLVPQLMARHQVPGVSIVGIENRRIAWERQYGVKTAGKPDPVTTQTLFEACSMSKPPAAYAALKLVEQGKLDLDRPLFLYLDKPYLAGDDRYQKITARMVLNHTTGLPNWREGGWGKGGPLKLIAEPGVKFGYSGEGFLFLQRVMEKITGEPFESHIRKTLFEPLGIVVSSYAWKESYQNLAASGHDAKGVLKKDRSLYTNANAAFSVYCTPGEYALFLVEMMKLDRSAPHSLSADSIRQMLTRQTPMPGSKPILRHDQKPLEIGYYGLGWAIDKTRAGDRIRHSGSNGTGFRCYCEFDPQRGSGIVIMTNSYSGEYLWKDLINAISEP